MVTFRLLGPVIIQTRQGDGYPITARPVRALLVALLLHPGQHVPHSRLTEHIWTDPPKSTRSNTRGYITALRKTLNDCHPGLGRHLETRRGRGDAEGSYCLTIDTGSIDETIY